MDRQLTGYADIDAMLAMLLEGAKAILGEQFFGLYLHGSLASGDFDYASSDVDFAIITNGEVDERTLGKLAEMHERIRVEHPKWGPKMEGVYIPRDVLRRYDPERSTYPHLGIEQPLRYEWHDAAEAIQRHILREYGVSIEGADISALIDPVSANDLRDAVGIILRGWWLPMLDQPENLIENAGYQPYAVLTMCRMLYTLQTGEIVSKPTAAHWALNSIEDEWTGVIQKAIEEPERNREEALDQTVGFIRYTLAHFDNKNPD